MTDHASKKTRIEVIEFIDGQQIPGDWDEFLKHRNDANRLFSIDIAVSEVGLLRDLLEVIHDDPLVKERCLDSHAISGVYAYDTILALQLPVAKNWAASEHQKLTIFCLQNALITIHNTGQNNNLRLLTDGASLVNRPLNVEGLLFSLLDGIVDHASELTLQARLIVDQLETDLQQFADKERIGQRILYLKRAAAHFEMALEAKHRTLMALLSLDTELIDLHRIREPLHDVVAHVEHSLRYIERMEDHLNELDRHFLLLLQDRTNNRLRLLTIISAIFMPLTLIAGIYGMNFHFMPELSWHYGYWGILLMMVSIALGLLWYFHHRGWFK